MTQSFYMGFEHAPYACFWCAENDEFWHNKAAEAMEPADISIVRSLLQGALREQDAAPTTKQGRIADALRLGGITLLPLPGGVFAACTPGGQLPVQSFSASIREPLTNIYAVLPLLTKRLQDEDTVYAEEILKNCYTLLRLATNLETAGRLETTGIATRAIDLAAMVESLCVCVRSVCREQGVEIRRQLPDTPVVVQGDTALLNEAILNILRNALQYTRDGNEITVKLFRAGSRAVLCIEDKGLGILPENLQHVFEPYFSADPYGDGGVPPGLGLGLAIAAYTARALGGTVTAESEFGEYTRITLALPLSGSTEGNVLRSDPADYLLNRYSPIYVQLCGICRLPTV